MHLGIIGIVLALAAPACGSKSQPVPNAPANVAPTPIPTAVAEPPEPAARPEPCSDNECGVRGMEFYAAEMCRCGTDESCAMAIEAESRVWSLADKSDMEGFTSDRGQTAYGKYFTCFQTARQARDQ